MMDDTCHADVIVGYDKRGVVGASEHFVSILFSSNCLEHRFWAVHNHGGSIDSSPRI